jgi:iron complex transport system substrate-binding protein
VLALRASLVIGALALAATSTTGCRRAEAASPEPWPSVDVTQPLARNLTAECVGTAAYDPGIDYFPDKTSVAHAVSFRVSYHGHYKLVEFEPQIGSREIIRYVLVQCGTPAPPGYLGARVVRVPVKRFVSTKVEASDAFARLGIVDRLVGVSSIRPIVVPEIVARYAAGGIAEVGTGTHSTIELAMAVVPDIVFTFYSAFADANLHAKLWEAGVVGVPLGDHFEPTALARSEWIKFLAVFFNAEQRATGQFERTVSAYRRLQERTASVSSRPGVVVGGLSSRTRWGLNGGQNYLARLIEDAGGRYVWTTDSTRSLDLADVEQVYDLSADAEVWIGAPSAARTFDVLIGEDPRLRYFGPVMRHRVYRNDKGRTRTGGYRLANETLTRPDVLLADVIRILHPALLPDYALNYHEPIQ